MDNVHFNNFMDNAQFNYHHIFMLMIYILRYQTFWSYYNDQQQENNIIFM